MKIIVKNAVLLSIIFLCFSCNKESVYIIEKGIINKKGTYYTKNYKITIKEFTNGSLTYAFSDKMNNLLFQQNILKAFNKNSFWCLYFDEDENLWVYNSDYQNTDIWIRNRINTEFVKKDFCKLELKIPLEFSELLNENVSSLCR